MNRNGYNNYKTEILQLTLKGLTSKEVESKLNAKYSKSFNASGIRECLMRWRKQTNKDNQIKDEPNILLFDIETAPILCWKWSLRQKYNNIGDIEQKSFMLCYSAKWLYSNNMIEDSVTPQEAVNQDDQRIVESLWELLDKADVVIGYNSQNFDEKKVNGRFLKYDMPEPSPFETLDIYKDVKKKFKIESKKLDYMAEYLGIEGKNDTDMQLWIDCVKGGSEQLKYMQSYCSQDIKVLEDVYLTMRPYIKHSNLGLFVEADKQVCPSCGSDELKEDGVYQTAVNSYQSYRCGNCSSLSRGRKNITSNKSNVRSL